MIKPTPFERRLQEDENKPKQPILPIRLNEDDLEMLKEVKKLIHQPKDSTTFKFLARYGYECITSSKNKLIIETIKRNLINNKRTGKEIIE